MLLGAINFITDVDYINSYSINGFNFKNNLLITILQISQIMVGT